MLVILEIKQVESNCLLCKKEFFEYFKFDFMNHYFRWPMRFELQFRFAQTVPNRQLRPEPGNGFDWIFVRVCVWERDVFVRRKVYLPKARAKPVSILCQSMDRFGSICRLSIKSLLLLISRRTCLLLNYLFPSYNLDSNSSVWRVISIYNCWFDLVWGCSLSFYTHWLKFLKNLLSHGQLYFLFY